MHAVYALYRLHESGHARRVCAGLVRETRALLGVLLNPNATIDAVKAMRALQLEAERIEAVQPARAAALRRRAARMGR